MTEKKTILIADSSWENRMILGEILKKNYRILEAESGEQALNLLYREIGNISLILLDAVDPTMQCVRLMNIIRTTADLPDTPIVLLTSGIPSQQEKIAINEGAWDFIAAPYNVTAVEERVKNVISRSVVKELEKKQSELESQAKRLAEANFGGEHDATTGFFTKNTFIRACKKALETERGLCLCAFRIENFDRFISLKGDYSAEKVRTLFSQFLLEALPPKTIFGKLENDVFVALSKEGMNYESVINFINGRISEAHDLYKDDPAGYARMAVTEADDRVPFEEILEKTIDTANNSALSNDERLFIIKTREITKSIEYDHNIEKQMEGVFERDEFKLVFTPVFNFSSNKITCLEVNTKWENPLLGHIRFKDYFHIFKKLGIVGALDSYVWEKAIKWLSDLKKKSLPSVRLMISIRREDLSFVDLAERFSALCSKYEVKTSDITIVFKNFFPFETTALVARLAASFKSKGFRLCLDDIFVINDYGTLKQLNFDVVGFHPDFTSSILDNDNTQNFIIVIFLLLKIISLKNIAYGVDTQEEALYLSRAGCENMSGKYFSGAISEYETENLLQKHGTLYLESLPSDSKSEIFPENYQAFINNKLIGAAGLFEISNGRIKVVMANEELKHISGVKKDFNLCSFEMSELIDADEQKIISDNLIANCRDNKIFRDQIRIKVIGEPGQTRHLRIRAANVWNIGDSHVFFVMEEDVTEIENLVISLRGQNEKYKKFLQAAKKITLEYDIKTDTLIVKDYRGNGEPHKITSAKFSENNNDYIKMDKISKENLWNMISFASLAQAKGSIVLKVDVSGNGELTDFCFDYTSLADSNGVIYKVLATGKANE